jgi:hypothetical protein
VQESVEEEEIAGRLLRGCFRRRKPLRTSRFSFAEQGILEALELSSFIFLSEENCRKRETGDLEVTILPAFLLEVPLPGTCSISAAQSSRRCLRAVPGSTSSWGSDEAEMRRPSGKTWFPGSASLAATRGATLREQAARRPTSRTRVAIVTAPGQEAQVDYGVGPILRDPESRKYWRNRLFVMTLNCSRKSVSLLTFRSSSRIWACPHQDSSR